CLCTEPISSFLPGETGATANHAAPLLCDLEAVWGVVLEAVACSGGLTSLVLAVLLIVKLRGVSDPARRSGLGPLLLLLGTLLGIFTISLAFLVGKTQVLCVVRRAFWGPLFALCFSCLLVQGVRLRRLVAGKSSPTGSTLAALGLALALVQGIISAEWVLLTVVREGHPACEYPPLDFALMCSYTLGLLLIAMEDREGETEKRRWKCNAVWVFLSSLASALLWVAWLGFYLYGNQALRGKGSRERGGNKDAKVLDEPALAVALVIQGWILLLFHAIPESHLYFFDTGRASPAPHFGDDHPAHSHQSFQENQAFSMEEHSASKPDVCLWFCLLCQWPVVMLPREFPAYLRYPKLKPGMFYGAVPTLLKTLFFCYSNDIKYQRCLGDRCICRLCQ
uniref:G protein-coupled receptor, class C, group 5, member Bb n=1 Tax=Xiphophorus couchianus TaxID=32473 RepID=A0A3B5M727_9TELE